MSAYSTPASSKYRASRFTSSQVAGRVYSGTHNRSVCESLHGPSFPVARHLFMAAVDENTLGHPRAESSHRAPGSTGLERGRCTDGGRCSPADCSRDRLLIMKARFHDGILAARLFGASIPFFCLMVLCIALITVFPVS
jgi:hypothetical protein